MSVRAAFLAAAALLPVCGLSTAVYGQDEIREHSPLREAFSGSVELGLDLAGNERDHDVELDQILRLQIDPPSRERLRVVSSVWMIEDLDGPESDTSYLRSLAGLNDDAVDPRLLTLYVERMGLQDQSTVRAGRQRIEDGVVYNRIDGLFFRVRKPKLSWYGFGGSRASVYEYGLNEFVAGGGVAARFPTRTNARLDLYYGEEIDEPGIEDDSESPLSSVSITQALSLRHYVDGRVTWYGNGLDEFWISARGVFEKPEAVYNVTYRSKQSVRTERVSDITDFVQVLGELNDYTDLSAVVSVPMSPHSAVSIQGQLHDAEEDTVITSNRDFSRYGAALDLMDLRSKYDATIAVDRWDAEDSDGQFTVTGEFTRNWLRTEITFGTAFDQYKDRVLLLEPTTLTPIEIDSREEVYTHYVELRHDMNENRGVSVRASLEEDEGPDSPQWWLHAAYTMRF